MIHVVGGTYFERCLFPPWNQIYGSAGRAAALISQSGTPTTLDTYISEEALTMLDPIAAAYGFEIDPVRTGVTYAFEYAHPLAEPRIVPAVPLIPNPPITLAGGIVLRFGMIEGDAIVQADTAVYDPQSAFDPVAFATNGSSASRLAVVMNGNEAAHITRERDPGSALHELLKHCDVAVIKGGAGGALVGVGDKVKRIPAYQTTGAFTIGSGDVFSGAFTKFWAVDDRDAFEAAELSSLAVASYVESQILPMLDEATLREPARDALVPDSGAKVYLAGPFFTLAQRWLVTEARSMLRAQGLVVLSPLHDVGVGDAHDVAPRDIQMLKNCDKVFAILDGSDEGTLFEVGYARAMNKRVICYTQTLTQEQLKMFTGTNCEIVDDFATAIALTAQK